MDRRLSAVVEKPRARAAVGSLRAEGVYDDSRSVRECGDGAVAIPVTDHPVETAVVEVVRERGEPRLQTLEDHLREAGWTDAELDRAPGSWAVVGSVVLVEMGDTPRAGEVGEALLALHGDADTVLAREGVEGQYRRPSVEVVAGEGDTATVHREHGVEYALDLAEVVFSPENEPERTRMGERASAGERVLDALAGVGYFTLPMAGAGARVTAIEPNPDAFAYLLENVARNGLTDRVEPYRADCRDVLDADEGRPFDRAVLGYSEAHEYLSWVLPAVTPGGVVHVHEATPEALAPERPIERLADAAAGCGRDTEIRETRTTEGHSEGIVHVVVDARVD